MKSHQFKLAKVVAAAIVVTAAAIFSFQVRELAAALLIFTLVFGTAGMVLLALILMQEAALWGVAEVEARLARVRVRHSHTSTRVRLEPD